MKKEGEETKLHYGIVNFEKRRHRRFNLDLPVEYSRADLFVKHGRAVNASEGGLPLYFREQMEIGQHLEIKLFFTSGSKMNSIEALVQVVWIDIHSGEGWGNYRTGVKFLDITPEDLNELRILLGSLSSS